MQTYNEIKRAEMDGVPPVDPNREVLIRAITGSPNIVYHLFRSLAVGIGTGVGLTIAVVAGIAFSTVALGMEDASPVVMRLAVQGVWWVTIGITAWFLLLGDGIRRKRAARLRALSDVELVAAYDRYKAEQCALDRETVRYREMDYFAYRLAMEEDRVQRLREPIPVRNV